MESLCTNDQLINYNRTFACMSTNLFLIKDRYLYHYSYYFLTIEEKIDKKIDKNYQKQD